jgi:hypothetical protein
MYNPTPRAFISTSPNLIDSRLAKLAFLTKSVTPKDKVIVLDTTESKDAPITKVFNPPSNISTVSIVVHQQLETLQSGTT